METILIIIILVVIFGGGGFYWTRLGLRHCDQSRQSTRNIKGEEHEV